MEVYENATLCCREEALQEWRCMKKLHCDVGKRWMKMLHSDVGRRLYRNGGI